MFYVDKEIEVRYAETDMMGVVYHGNYPAWMEIGRTAFSAKLGYDYKAMEDAGIQAPVYNLNITYKVPVRYGDTVFIRTWLKKCTPFRSTYRALVFNGEGEVCIDAVCESTCVEKDTFKLASFKKFNPAWYETYQQIAVGENEAEMYENNKINITRINEESSFLV